MNIFECSNCSKKLRSRVGIVRHLKKCMERTRKDATNILKTQHSCEYCLRQFFTRNGLLKHLKKYHGHYVPIKKNKSLKCKYCSATFTSTHGRIQHSKKKHLEYRLERIQLMNRRLHNCIFCEKSFTRKSYRNQHEEKCMKKSSFAASSSMGGLNITAFNLQQNSLEEHSEHSYAYVNTPPFLFQNTSKSIETPQFESTVVESLNNTSAVQYQKKWKSLQDCYMRERRIRKSIKSDSAAKHHKVYVYYEQPTFLEAPSSETETADSLPDESQAISEEWDVDNDLEEKTLETPLKQANMTPRFQKYKKRSPKVINKEEEELLQILKRKYLENDSQSEPDGDKLFLLSLYDELKSIPPKIKIRVKSQILELISSAQQSTQVPQNHRWNYSAGGSHQCVGNCYVGQRGQYFAPSTMVNHSLLLPKSHHSPSPSVSNAATPIYSPTESLSPESIGQCNYSDFQ